MELYGLGDRAGINNAGLVLNSRWPASLAPDFPPRSDTVLALIWHWLTPDVSQAKLILIKIPIDAL
jgi:hypothetical protein